MILNNIFKVKNVKYNFRNYFSFATKNVKSVHYGSETISYIESKNWKLLPKNIKKWEKFRIKCLTRFQLMFNLSRNQVVGFYYQNVCKTPV